MNKYSPAIELKVFCYTQTESGALIHAKLCGVLKHVKVWPEANLDKVL